jgi:hypothetical protein
MGLEISKLLPPDAEVKYSGENGHLLTAIWLVTFKPPELGTLQLFGDCHTDKPLSPQFSHDYCG